MLIHSLLGVEVAIGLAVRAAERLVALDTAGFDEAMKAALRAEDVLCEDESPVNVLTNDLDESTGEQVAGAPNAVTLRTPDARLIWYAAMPSRSKDSIADLGVLDYWHGYLVRDDYVGWHQFDPHLAGVQQCCADKAIDWGITTNRHRDWHKGNHPGYSLAQRLKDKAKQDWLFAKNFKISWTNNASEQAFRGPKRHQPVSGYWHSTNTPRSGGTGCDFPVSPDPACSVAPRAPLAAPPPRQAFAGVPLPSPPSPGKLS